MTHTLTPTQQRAFDFIKGYIASNNEAPTNAEIGRRLGMKSGASVHQIITALEQKGLITKTPNISRGIKLVNQPQGATAG